MAPYYDVIGDGAQGFVVESDGGSPNRLTMKDGWMVANKTRCRINGHLVDVTDTPIGSVVRVEEWTVERITGGLRARGPR